VTPRQTEEREEGADGGLLTSCPGFPIFKLACESCGRACYFRRWGAGLPPTRPGRNPPQFRGEGPKGELTNHDGADLRLVYCYGH
jgi:hypothetical protein